LGATGGQGDAATIQKAQASHATDLFNIGSPGMQLALGSFIKDLGQPGQIPDSVKQAFDKISTLTDQQFGNEAAQAPSAIAQQMKQSGYRGAAGAQQYDTSATLAQLEKNRLAAQNTNRINEVNQGLSQQAFDLQNIFGIVSGATNQSNMFAGNALGATGMNSSNPWGSAASGALGGASAGAALGPWGALAGGVGGGLAGYFSGGGG
jgi:hypothetical protein